MKYFSRRYNLISLTELFDGMISKSFKNIPKYAMVVTLDDGWKENYDLLSIIKKYNFRPTLFLTSHLINTERHFWWTTCDENDVERLKRLPNSQRIAELKEKWFYDPDKEYLGDRQALNISEIEMMKEHVDFGLHTCYHPILTKCSFEEKRKEIIACKNKVEEILEYPIEFFSYPNGDYDDECIEILRKCGVKIARTTDSGWNNTQSNLYKLKVTGVSDNGSKNKLIAELTGIPMYFQHFFKGSFNGLKNTN
ncbi:MAG: polysaccharide deacetylase family protein [Marinilabiliaceae bacterium]|nr:polysaccharide deacetylase family protein [Marinilabiliaceae bacterium]